MSTKLAARLGFAFLSALAFQLAVATHVPLAAQEEGSGDAQPTGDAVEAYLKLSAPGPEHKKLRLRVGNWKVAGTFYMAPGAPPMKSEASSVVRPIMGGRYFRENYTGEFLGHDFTGLSIFGYDKGLKKYVSSWIDSMSTGLMRTEGAANESGDVITFKGKYFDPMREAMVENKYVLTLTSRKTHSTAMFEVADDGSERKVMELVYTRISRSEGAKKQGKKQGKKQAKKS